MLLRFRQHMIRKLSGHVIAEKEVRSMDVTNARPSHTVRGITETEPRRAVGSKISLTPAWITGVVCLCKADSGCATPD